MGKSLGSLASTQRWWPSCWCSLSVVRNISPPWGADLVVHIGLLGPLSLTNPSFLCQCGDSTQELLVPLEMSCCASPLKSSHPGRRQVLSPFFDLNLTWFISEEVVAFHCAKRLFFESTESQSHSTHSHITGGKPFIHFISFFPWESSPKPEVSLGKARGILTVLVLHIVK